MNTNDVDIFDISDKQNILFPESRFRHGSLAKDIFRKIKDKKYIKYILEGAYMDYRYMGNTFFHDCIANDETKYALCLLKFIDEIAKENGISNQLNKLIPFTEFENGDKTNTYVSDIKKNFLMLAIAKKYDNSKEKPEIQSIVQKYKHKKEQKQIVNQLDENNSIIINAMKQYGASEDMIRKAEYNNLLEKIICEDRLEELEKLDPMTLNHKDRYQNDDIELIHWLIDKAPMECLQQKDSAGYNLADYALMKMDLDILNQLLEKEPKLLESSKLYNDVLSGKFSYKEAAKKVDERYSATIAIADENEWNSEKEKIRQFLQERNNMKPVNNQKIEEKEKEKSNGIG